MLPFVRRSLLVQLLSVYLLFVIVVLLGGMEVNTVVEQQLRNDVQASDQALAQEIALQTGTQLSDAEEALVTLGKYTAQATTQAAIENTFRTFQAARGDVDTIYWLDPFGGLRTIWPHGKAIAGTEFSPTGIIERARIAHNPVFEVGIAAETTLNAGVIIAEPVRASTGELIG